MLIKTKDEIKQIVRGGSILAGILSKLVRLAQAGITTWEIDQAAEELITQAGGRPSFKGYMSRHYDPPFPCTICASRNHELVHGIAKKDVVLSDGDVFSIDIGMEYPMAGKQSSRTRAPKARGWYTDTSITVAIGAIDPKVKELMRVTKQALEVGIRAVRPGRSIASIGKAIEEYVNSQGKYGIVRDLVGHGVGHEVHEEPRVPNYYDKRLEDFIIKPGMVLALEPMISLGGREIKVGDDGWTIEMADGSMCAHFEHTVIVNNRGCEVATRRPGEKNEQL